MRRRWRWRRLAALEAGRAGRLVGGEGGKRQLVLAVEHPHVGRSEELGQGDLTARERDGRLLPREDHETLHDRVTPDLPRADPREDEAVAAHPAVPGHRAR